MRPYVYDPEIGKSLTLKQYWFVKNYLTNGFNATQAVLLSSYNVSSYGSAKSIGYKNLTNVYLRRAISKEFEDAGLTNAGVCEMMRVAIEAGLGVDAKNSDSIRALEMVYKLRGKL